MVSKSVPGTGSQGVKGEIPTLGPIGERWMILQIPFSSGLTVRKKPQQITLNESDR